MSETYLASGSNDQPSANETITIFEVHQVMDSQSDASSTDEDQWDAENFDDPYDAERLSQELNAGKDNLYLARVYLAHRMATRKYRAAKGKFGPRRRFGRRRIAKKFTRRGPSRFGKTGPSRGFFIGEVHRSQWCAFG